MPTAINDGVSLYYETDGDGETVVFVEDIGYGAWLWSWQYAALAGPYETLVWDLRGTGRSDAPPGPYTVAQLAADLDAILSEHGVRRAHLVGVGLGGMIALEYALEYSRARTLTVVGTTAGGEDATIDLDGLCVNPDDVDGLRESLRRVLSAEFFESQPDVVDGIVEWRREDDVSEPSSKGRETKSHDADEDGWRAQAAAMESFDVSDRLHELTLPTRILHGAEDAVIPASNARDLFDGLPNAQLEEISGAGHLCIVEQSKLVNDRLFEFLETHAEDP